MTGRPTGSHCHWGTFDGELLEGTLVGVRPFAGDADPSPMLNAISEAVTAPTRIRAPAVRESWLRHGPCTATERRGAEPFIEVGWDEALDLAARELARVREVHGNTAIYAGSNGWGSAGAFHHAQSHMHRFLAGIGGWTGQIGNYSWGAALTFLPYVVGTAEGVQGPIGDWNGIVGATELLVMFGGARVSNSQVASGGAVEHSLRPWLARARAAGCRIVSVSPLRDDTPDFARDEWLAVRPGTDTALMLGIAHTLWHEELCNRDFLARYTCGFERFLPYLADKDAAWAEPICDIQAETIRQLARRMAASRTMLTASWALQRARYGEQPYWMLITLAAMLGQIGLPGGGFGFGYGSIGSAAEPRLQVPVPRVTAPPNPTGCNIPAARIGELLERPGGIIDFDGRRITLPDIRLIYWAGGNPFHHHQDLNRLRAAWRRPDTVIVHDPWWSATARHADIVLPAASFVERNDIGASSRDRHMVAMRQLIPPVGQSRSDYAIFAGLAERFGIGDGFTEGRDEMGWLRHLYDVARDAAAVQGVPLPDFDTFWHCGHVELPAPQSPFVMLSAFRDDPISNRLATPSGRIEIFSQRIAALGFDDCPPHPSWIEPEEWLGAPLALRFPLHLITNQPATRLHSQMDDCNVSRASKIAGREPIRLNPLDAAARNISTGDIVRVFNDRGSCLAGAVLDDAVRQSVVQLSTGAWLDPENPARLDSLDKHGNPNVLTLDIGTSRLAQGSSAQSVLVDVARCLEAQPNVTAFDPPVHRARS
jgi:biotin/methionine sulfoxide reductase